MLKQHYVYLHRKETDGAIFYVGKGKDRRAWSAQGRSRQWVFIQRKHGFTVQIVQKDMSEYCALTLERIHIAKIGMANLANATEGGGGIQGWKHSEETKRKIAEAGKGRKLNDNQRAALERYRYMERTPEHRRNMSIARLGYKPAPHSSETRAKIAASHIGLKPSPEALLKMSLAKIGKACGRDSPTYDHTVRAFHHAEHGDFIGTRAELISKHRLADGCMSAMINGDRRSVKGWRLK